MGTNAVHSPNSDCYLTLTLTLTRTTTKPTTTEATSQAQTTGNFTLGSHWGSLSTSFSVHLTDME